MTDPRVKTGLWVKAQIRICDLAFMPAVVIRRGDADAGQVMIVRNLLDGTFEVFARTVTLDGDPAWRRASGEDPVDGEAKRSLIDREARFDPDLWVIEIEDRDRKYELDGPLV